MTLKQKKLAQAYLKTGNKTKAAIMAGYSPKTAYSKGPSELKKIEPQLNRLMDRMGLSERGLLKPICEGILATKFVSGMLVKVDGEIEEANKEVPDHSNRLKACELGWKLRGHLKNSPDEDDRPRPILIMTGAATVQVSAPTLVLNGNGNGNGHSTTA